MDTGTPRQLLRGHMGPIWCMVYDPSSGRIVSGSDDYTVRCDMNQPVLADMMSCNKPTTYSPADATHTPCLLRYWDAQAGHSVSLQDPDSSVRCIHLDPQGHQLVAGTEFGKLLLWDTHELEGE